MPIYDEEVQRGDLSKYDWLHLHHEDFTGQLNKFHLGYRDSPWFVTMNPTYWFAALAPSLRSALSYGSVLNADTWPSKNRELEPEP